MSVGERITVETTDGQRVTGTIAVTSPDKIMVATAWGQAFILRDKIASLSSTPASS